MANTSSEQNQNPGAAPESNDPAEGYYDAMAVEGSEVYGESEGGNEQVAIELRLIDLNRTVISILNFSDKAAPYSLERLKALGWEGGDSLVGIGKNKVQVRAKREYWNDRETGEAKTAMKYEIQSGGRFAFAKPMDEQKKRGFFAKLNDLASRGTAAKGAGGYPADWDKPGAATGAKPPRVDLG